MKKIVFALVVLMLAAPASAEVIITCEQEPNEPNMIISYECTGGEVVRCFGLDIQLDNEETITAVECLSDDYYLNPQKFSYDGMTPNFGDTPCLCNAGDGLLGAEANGITIAMCSLYAEEDPDHNLPPATANGLVKITVSGSACITITENSKLGGLLDEDNVPIEPNLPGEGECCAVVGCPCDGDILVDGYVAFSDVGQLVNDLIACSWFCQPGWPCWKVCDDFNEDGYMAFSDVGALVNHLIAVGWFEECP